MLRLCLRAAAAAAPRAASFRGMQRASAGQVTGVTKTELCLWETNWLESAKQLNQWELVSDFARSVDHTELQLHSSWRHNDWQGVKDLLPTSASTSEVEETPELYVIRVYTALNSGMEVNTNVHLEGCFGRSDLLQYV